MKEKKFTLKLGLITCLLAIIVLQPVMSQKKIAFVTNAYGTAYYRDSSTIVALKDKGYTVDTIYDRNIDDLANSFSLDLYNRVLAADIVIISRSIASGNYDGASKTNWATVTKPVLLQSPYAARSAQIGMFPNSVTTMINHDTNTVARFKRLNDPILKSVTLAADSTVLFYIDKLNYFVFGADSLERKSNLELVASGDSIGKRRNFVLIARLDSGKVSFTGSTFKPKAKWTFMSVGAAEQVSSKNNFQFTDAGKQIFFNEIERLLAGTPNTPRVTDATNVTGTGFKANWDTTSTTKGYRLDIATDATFTNFVAGFKNLNVARVYGYNVTGLTANTAYYYRVRAYNADTSAYSSVITVTTSANTVVSVTGITVAGGNAISTKGGTLQMTATIAPDNATDKTVAWSVNDATIATINANGLLTAVKNGTVKVIASANGGTNIKDTLDVTISGQNVGMKKVNAKSLIVYPNPASEILNIESAKAGRIEILNALGKVVISETNNTSSKQINISNLKPGTYMVRTVDKKVYKFVKK